MPKKTTPTQKSLARFHYFAECEDSKRLPEIPLDPNGFSAAECFHVHETYGQSLPCREPTLLSRALNGKQWHGVTITTCAEDYLNRLLFASDIKSNYPPWVQHEIFSRATQLQKQKLGYVLPFVFTGNDFSTLLPQPAQQPKQQHITWLERLLLWVRSKIPKCFTRAI